MHADVALLLCVVGLFLVSFVLFAFHCPVGNFFLSGLFLRGKPAATDPLLSTLTDFFYYMTLKKSPDCALYSDPRENASCGYYWWKLRMRLPDQWIFRCRGIVTVTGWLNS